MSALKKTLRDNRWACWLALACLVVPMFASYFFDDMFSSLSELFKNPETLELGWDMSDYGFYASGYSFLCIWGGLIICGALLDKFGVRLVGSIFVGMMTGGAALVTFAISAGFAPETSLAVAYVGCMLFGLGSEIAGVSVTRSIAKWFKGRNMALAMGLQLAIARFGTATAILVAPMIVRQKAAGEIYTLAETNRPALIGLAVLAVGTILWAVFVAMDARFDKPDVVVKIEVREEYAYIHAGQDKGAGGMPLGSAGKGLLLLSGGIDSPVAGYMMMRRGMTVECVHFESFPYTSEAARDKVLQLAQELTEYCGKIKVHIISLTHIQEMLRDNCEEDYFTLLLRRYMMKLASRTALANECPVIVTGESLGQVASQTLKAMCVTEDASDCPVFRPLIGMDKEEIIRISRMIGTFDTSILPFDDCCTVFTPRHPRTQPELEKVLREEAKVDFDALLEEAWATRNTVVLHQEL